MQERKNIGHIFCLKRYTWAFKFNDQRYDLF